MARKGHDRRSDDETACLQAMAAVLSGALRREQMIDATTRQSQVDALTGAYDRRYLQHRFESDVARAAGMGESVALVFADINGMKAINDGLGHEAGDEVLRRFVRCIASSIRSSDYVVRYGGDEFVIVLNSADSTSARQVIDRIRKKLSGMVLQVGTAVVPFPGSAFGIAVAPDEFADLASLLRLADSRMYEDKPACAAVARCSSNASA